MICRYCFKEIPDGVRFCHHCGGKVKGQSSAAKVLSALGKSLCYLVFFFAVQIVSIMGYGIALGVKLGFSLAISDSFTDPDALSELLMHDFVSHINEVLIFSSILTVLLLLAFFMIRRLKFSREIRLRAVSPLPLLGTFLIGVALQLAVIVTLSIISPILPDRLFDTLESQYDFMFSGSQVALILNIAVLTPIVEEIVFRGLIFTRLRRAMPNWTAVAVSAVIFGAAHGNVIGFAYATLLGIILALVFARYDSVIPGILIHAGFNGASLLFEYYFPTNDILVMSLYFVSLAAIVGILYLLLKKSSDDAPEEAFVQVTSQGEVPSDSNCSNGTTAD